jgi:hypothetical protein
MCSLCPAELEGRICWAGLVLLIVETHHLAMRSVLHAQVRDMEDGSAVWIAKPSITNQAVGICIFDRVSTLRAALEAAEDMHEWVLQMCASLARIDHAPRRTSLSNLCLVMGRIDVWAQL